MLRNSLILALVLIGFLLSGFFNVDQREVGLISYPAEKSMQTYMPGLHWKVPLYGDLSYVFTNQRSSYLAMSQPLAFESGAAISKILVTWQVGQAESYLGYLNKNSTKIFDAELSQSVLSKLEILAARSQNAVDFNRRVEQENNWSLNELGIKVLELQLISLKFVPIISNGASKATDSLSSESSFILAQEIKNQANNSQLEEFANLRVRDPKFFDYVLKIHNLEKSAKSKQDVPALEQLYN